MNETNENSYSGGHTCLEACSFSEIQSLYNDIINDKPITKTVAEVKYPMKLHNNVFNENNHTLIETTDTHVEGGSFIFKPTLQKHLPELLIF